MLGIRSSLGSSSFNGYHLQAQLRLMPSSASGRKTIGTQHCYTNTRDLNKGGSNTIKTPGISQAVKVKVHHQQPDTKLSVRKV